MEDNKINKNRDNNETFFVTEFDNSIENNKNDEKQTEAKESINNFQSKANPVNQQASNKNRNINGKPKYYRKSNNSEFLSKKTALYLSIFLVASCSVLGFCAGMLGVDYSNNNNSTTQNSNNSVVQTYSQSTSYSQNNSTKNNMSIASVVENTCSSVVEISTETIKTNDSMNQYISSGAGSGVIIDQDGYIVTNYHVISGANKVTVTLNDGRAFQATIIGKDSSLDIALIKIDAQDLNPATLGDSEALRVGENIVCIGNPLGQLGGSVTSGIISALNRDITINGETMNLFQTNAAINPGNSGGGIFNANSELVGIVVAKYSSASIEGIGFAIPVNDIKAVIAEIKEYGYVRGKIDLEISITDIDSSPEAKMYNVNSTGVLVTKVPENSNASAAGFKIGDFITSINDTTVNSVRDFRTALAEHSAGDTVKITVKRGQTISSLSLTLAEDKPN